MAVKWPLAGLHQSWFNGRRCKLVCKTWSQPDGNHIRGLCTNELFAEGNSNNCSICVTPIDTLVPECGCFAPEKARQIYYLSVTQIAGTFLSECVMNSFLGQHVLTGKCNAAGGPAEQINYFTFIYDPPRPCEPLVAHPQNIGMMWVGGPIGPFGSRRAGVKVGFYYAQMITGGALPGPVAGQLACEYSGIVPWCTSSRGSAVLGYYRGPAGNCLSVSISTEPFD